MSARSAACFTLLCLLATSSTAAGAGRALLRDVAGSSPWVQVQFARPSFASDVMETSAFSGHWELAAAAPLGGTALLVELPFTHYAIEADLYDWWDERLHFESAENRLGNLFVGIQAGVPGTERGWTGACFGVHLPTASSDDGGWYEIDYLPVAADLLSFYRYLPDLLTVEGSLLARFAAAPGTTLGLEVGPHICVPLEGSGDAELFLHHGAFIEVGGRVLTVFVEVAGQVWLGAPEEPELDHVAAAGAGFDLGRLEPAVFVSFPLSFPMDEALSHTLGLQCRIDLGR